MQNHRLTRPIPALYSLRIKSGNTNCPRKEINCINIQYLYIIIQLLSDSRFNYGGTFLQFKPAINYLYPLSGSFTSENQKSSIDSTTLTN
jgi:hypothetical protein